MKRRLFWLLAIGGAIWLYLRRGARRPEPVGHVPPYGDPSGDPADELRRKLDETKDRGESGESEPASHLAEPEAEQAADDVEPSAPVVSDELDARRREIHERARSASDEMRGTSSD